MIIAFALGFSIGFFLGMLAMVFIALGIIDGKSY